MNVITKNIPNAVTCLNVVAGTLSIICAFHGAEPWWGLCGWQWACIFIGIGAIADFLDGFCARMLRAYSELGKELDSLCDLVSFGVAPALLLFNVLPLVDAEPWLKWLTPLIPVGAALRLARFNIDTRQASFFIGLPVPANAIFWIGFCGMITRGAAFLYLPVIFIPVLLVEVWLMLSPLKLFSLKVKSLGFKANRYRYLLVLALAIFVFTMGVGGLMWLIIFYILLSACVGVKS